MERKEALSSLYELYKRFYYYLLLSYYIIKMKLVSLMYSLQICLLPEAFFLSTSEPTPKTCTISFYFCAMSHSFIPLLNEIKFDDNIAETLVEVDMF